MIHELPRFPKAEWLAKKLETPMLVLSFAWMIILIVELSYIENSILLLSGTVIWLLLIAYFVIRMLASTERAVFIKKNWLFVAAILITVLRYFPSLQSFAVVRIINATFGVQVIWLFTSAVQSMRSFQKYVGRRGIGYAVVLTIVVVAVGAAGMLNFEKPISATGGIKTYPEALWWAAMQITTVGSGYSITSAGGRIIALAISLYAVSVYGYITALVASFFIDNDAMQMKTTKTHEESLQLIHEELVKLRQSLEKKQG